MMRNTCHVSWKLKLDQEDFSGPRSKFEFVLRLLKYWF
jgi:hypothetical protein